MLQRQHAINARAGISPAHARMRSGRAPVAHGCRPDGKARPPPPPSPARRHYFRRHRMRFREAWSRPVISSRRKKYCFAPPCDDDAGRPRRRYARQATLIAIRPRRAAAGRHEGHCAALAVPTHDDARCRRVARLFSPTPSATARALRRASAFSASGTPKYCHQPRCHHRRAKPRKPPGPVSLLLLPHTRDIYALRRPPCGIYSHAFPRLPPAIMSLFMPMYVILQQQSLPISHNSSSPHHRRPLGGIHIAPDFMRRKDDA